MKNQFVTYEIALKLKELGFNEECFSFYKKNKKLRIKIDGMHKNTYSKNITCAGVTAPLWQQAIDWLYYRYKLCIYIKPDKVNTRCTKCIIENQFENKIIITEMHIFPNDSRKSGILKSLELIK